MADSFSKKKRSWMMSRIRSDNTKPEKIVRSFLHGEGYRFRLYDNSLPGKPDIVLKKYNTVIFVNGCFWHQHKGCKRQTVPKTNIDYWEKKLSRNIERQKEAIRLLKRSGWKVIIICECQTKNKDKIIKKIKDLTNEKKAYRI